MVARELPVERGSGNRCVLVAASRHTNYVIVPPQFRSWGAPPPPWYIDNLMRHEGRPYYVDLLKAAELHGASHQAVMEFQVVTDKRLPKIRAGRSAIAFYYRKEMDDVAVGLVDHKTDTGNMKVSSPELTALDLLRYPHASGGVDHIATVLADLGERLDGRKLARLSAAFERSVVQRLGYLLGGGRPAVSTDALYEALLRRGPVPWVELEPVPAPARAFLTGKPVRDGRWRVIIRRHPEADE